MAIEADTKDCTALSDAELAEMADLCAEGPSLYEVGLLSKQAEAWVLITQAYEGRVLRGFSFCTLERIGGTPSVLIGLASIKRTSKRTGAPGRDGRSVPRAVLAFPDEDVLVGSRVRRARRLGRLPDARGRRAPTGAQGVGRGAGLGPAAGQALRDRQLRRPSVRGRRWGATASSPWCLDHSPLKSGVVDSDGAASSTLWTPVAATHLIAFGWAVAEDLSKFA